MRRRGHEPAAGDCPAQRAANLGRYVFWGWLALLPILVAIAVTQRRAELERMGAAFWAADRRWIAAGVGLEVGTVAAAALIYALLLGRLGYRLPGRALASVHLQRSAAAAVSPLSGPTSAYVFLQFLGRHRVPVHDALLAVGLRSLAGQVAAGSILVLGLALLEPQALLPLAAGVVTLLAIVVTIVRLRPTAIPWVWARRPRSGRLGAVSAWLTRLSERFRRHHLSPRILVWPATLCLTTRLAGFALLFTSLRAVGAEVTASATVVACLAAMLARITLPVFGGAGLVEGATVAALVQSGVSADLALAATMLWRLIDFWLPLAIGLALQAGVLLDPVLARRPPTQSAPRPGATPRSQPVVAWSGAGARTDPGWER